MSNYDDYVRVLCWTCLQLQWTNIHFEKFSSIVIIIASIWTNVRRKSAILVQQSRWSMRRMSVRPLSLSTRENREEDQSNDTNRSSTLRESSKFSWLSPETKTKSSWKAGRQKHCLMKSHSDAEFLDTKWRSHWSTVTKFVVWSHRSTSKRRWNSSFFFYTFDDGNRACQCWHLILEWCSCYSRRRIWSVTRRTKSMGADIERFSSWTSVLRKIFCQKASRLARRVSSPFPFLLLSPIVKKPKKKNWNDQRWLFDPLPIDLRLGMKKHRARANDKTRFDRKLNQ